MILMHLIRNENMNVSGIFPFAVGIFAATQLTAPSVNSGRVVEVKTADSTILKGTYFAAAKPGPGVLLFHQSNRTRKSWDDVGRQLSAAGINTLTVDVRGHGDTGGNFDNWTGPKWKEARKQWWPGDLDAAFQFLVSQPGVTRDVIGMAGAGLLGVDNSVETARHHATEVKSLVLISGETLRPQLQFLHEASQLPELFVVSDDDEYPPTQQAMQLLYDIASSPSKKLIHYSAANEAPWLWYEPFDIGKVPAKSGHGTDLFKPHPDLPAIIVDWFIRTLIKTPGHAPADSVACAATINQLQAGRADQVAQRLAEARKKDPHAQLFPEITAGIIGFDYMREGDLKSAIAVLKLVVTAYPDSADANGNLADAYLADGQKDLAKRYAEEALALLDAHKVPASSWADTNEYRGEVRRSAEKTLKQLTPNHN
jgi:tetratricopeptide (TPR) repeat protein